MKKITRFRSNTSTRSRGTTPVWTAGVACLALGLLPSLVHAQRPDPTEWTAYGGDVLMQKYSPLAQVTKDNVTDLRVAWRWASPDNELQQSNQLWQPARYEDTPLMVNGVLYTITSLGMVAALDAATGETRWLYDPETYKAGRPTNVGFVSRGLAYWTDGDAERILVGSADMYLLSIDAKTGEPDEEFGDQGRVDMTVGIRDARRTANIAGRRPLVAGDVIVVGNTIADSGGSQTAPPGYVHAFDARTGDRLWTFHTVPTEYEFGYDTWENGSAEYSGASNVWGGMAYDPDLDYVYMASSTPNNDYYGGHRPGDNLFAESLICVEAQTGRRVWHFQTVHHGLWDYDLPADPILGDVTVDGRRVRAVMQISKQAFTYAFDRETGEPLWPIVERPVPQSSVPGEATSPTQPFPTKPPPFDLQGSTEDNVIDFTPELKQRALAKLEQVVHGPLFTPPSLTGTLQVPGNYGAANWGGAGFDPETGLLYVPSRMYPLLARVSPTNGDEPDDASHSGGGTNRNESIEIDGLSIMKPPYSRVTAIDMNKGEIAWMTPLGNGPRNHPLLRDLDVGPLGDAIHGGSVLVTKTLVFVSITHLQYNGVPNPPVWAEWDDPDAEMHVIYVFNKATGALVHVVDLDTMSAAAPMSYEVDGRQYIVLAAGGRETSELVAFSLPD